NQYISSELPGVNLSAHKLGRILNYLGIPKKRTNQGARYDVAEWSKGQNGSEPAVSEAVHE
ncbi:unnamed protein product, partial [marine sediment metagenome]